MIQGFMQTSRVNVPQRAAAVLLAIFLNIAMIPCSMAIEVIEHEHDCCPPELQLKASECCELDSVSVDARDGAVELEGDVEAGPAPFAGGPMLPAPPRYSAALDPPDPPGTSADLNKLYCVYLK
jgi:hypothetical protein